VLVSLCRVTGSLPQSDWQRIPITRPLQFALGGGRISVVAEEGENAGDTQKTLAT
jgi:hypothetical protein